MKKNSKKGYLMLKHLVLIFIIWFTVIYLLDIFLLKVQDFLNIDNSIFNFIFINRDFFDCSPRRYGGCFEYATIFDLVLLLMVPYFTKRYYYTPRISKIK